MRRLVFTAAGRGGCMARRCYRRVHRTACRPGLGLPSNGCPRDPGPTCGSAPGRAPDCPRPPRSASCRRGPGGRLSVGGDGRSSSGARRGRGRWTAPTGRASGRCSCTAWVARRRTGPIWRRCSPCASTGGPWTCRASAGPGRRARARYSVRGHVRAVVDLLEHVRDLRATARGAPVHLRGQLPRRPGQPAGRGPAADLVASLTLISPAMPVTACRRRSAGRSCSSSSRACRRWPPPHRRHSAGGERPRHGAHVLRPAVAGAAGAPGGGRPGDARARWTQPWADAALVRQHARAHHVLPDGWAAANAWRAARWLTMPTLVVWDAGPARSIPRWRPPGGVVLIPASGARGRRSRGDARGAGADRPGGARHGRGGRTTCR